MNVFGLKLPALVGLPVLSICSTLLLIAVSSSVVGIQAVEKLRNL
jgi:hypothetical protein